MGFWFVDFREVRGVKGRLKEMIPGKDLEWLDNGATFMIIGFLLLHTNRKSQRHSPLLHHSIYK